MAYYRYTDPEDRDYFHYGPLRQGSVVNHQEDHGALDHRFQALTEAEVAEHLASQETE